VKVLLRMILRPVKFCSRQEIRLADIAPSNSLLGAIGVYRWLYGGYVEYWAQCIPMAPSKLHSTQKYTKIHLAERGKFDSVTTVIFGMTFVALGKYTMRNAEFRPRIICRISDAEKLAEFCILCSVTKVVR